MGIIDSSDLSPSSVGEENIGLPSAGFDLEPSRYMGELDGLDITETQKIELLETLWTIMRGMVDLGFDMAEVDLCGQLFAGFNEASDGSRESVESASTTQEKPVGKDRQ